MDRHQAIAAGLIKPTGDEKLFHECVRKTAHPTLPDAISVAHKLIGKGQAPGKRLMVYVCPHSPSLHFHLGNYTPSIATLAGRFAVLQKEHAAVLGKLAHANDQLKNCNESRQRARSKVGQLEARLHRKHWWNRLKFWERKTA